MGVWWAITSGVASAHGIQIDLEREGSVLQGQVREPRGPAIAGMPVRVTRAGETALVGEAVSDAAGRFSFAVDPRQGYRIVVDDGLGHRAIADVAPMTNTPRRTPDTGFPWRALVLGLGLIAGLTGIAAWLLGRRRLS